MLYDVYILSCGSYLSETLTPAYDGVKIGDYSLDDYTKMGYKSISIVSDECTVESMAVHVATKIMHNANVNGKELAALTFNAVHRHGHPQLWCPASYLQHELNAEGALPFSIYQGCNGQLQSISMLSYILQCSDKPYALSVASDKFSSGGINRWNGDYGIVYGDAASALILSRKSGILKILDMYTVSDASLESMHRFDSPFMANDINLHDKQYNIKATKKEFIKNFGKSKITDATKKSMAKLWSKIFSNNGITPEDVKYFVVPNLAEDILNDNYFSIYPNMKKKSLWFYGSTVGHLGASDVCVSLDYLCKNAMLNTGDKVLCIGAGAGFSWSFMLLEKTAMDKPTKSEQTI